MKKLIVLLALLGAERAYAQCGSAGTPIKLNGVTVCAPRMAPTFTGNVTIGNNVFSPATSEPTCNSSNRGVVVAVRGGAGAADSLRQCQKKADNTYDWIGLAISGAGTGDMIAANNLSDIPDDAAARANIGAGDVNGASNLSTAGRVAYIASAGVLTSAAGLAFNSGTNSLGVIGNVTIGQTGTATGELRLNGTTSGTAVIKPPDAAGTPTLTLPTTSGTFALTSQIGTIAGKNASATSGRCAQWSADGTSLDSAAAACGAGAGDVVGQASSVDSELALFSGTGGKTIKRASMTGIPYLTSGVLGSATGANIGAAFSGSGAYLKKDGTSADLGTIVTKNASATASRCAQWSADGTTLESASGGCATGAAATTLPYTATVTSQTTLTVTAATHGQGALPLAACFESGAQVDCAWSRNGSGDVTFTWSPAWSGTIQIGISGASTFDATKSGAILFSGITSGGIAWGVADVAGTLTTLLYPTDSSTATTGKVLAIGDAVTCPTLPSGMPTTCRATTWATAGGGISWVTPPVSPDSSGTDGQLAKDATYLYAYHTDRWQRIAWDSTWLIAVATPAFDNDTATYNNPVTVAISTTTSGDAICYTTDNSTPGAATPGTCDSSPTNTYSTPVSITATGTVLKAIGSKAGMSNSSVKSATYTLKVGTISASPSPGAVSSGQVITLSSTTSSGVTYHWTTDGTDPTCSTGSTGNPTVTASTTYEVIGCKGSYVDSDIATFSYTVSVAAIQFISATPTCGVTNTTASPIDTTGANFLVLAVSHADNTNALNLAITDSVGGNSNTGWALVRRQGSVGQDPNLQLLVNVNPTYVGSGHTFTVSGGTAVGVCAAAFSGVAISSPTDQQSGAIVLGTSIQPGSITPTQDNELVITAINYTSDNPSPSVSGYTVAGYRQLAGGVNYGVALAYAIQTTAAATNPLWTGLSNSYNTALAVSFKKQ